MSSSLYHILTQTSIAWLAHYNTFNSPTYSWATGRTINATHTILPASNGFPPGLNNTAMQQNLRTTLPGLHNYSAIRVGDMPTIIDTEKKRIVMHLHGTGTSDIGPYENEYVFVLETTEDGKLIERSFEFTDSFLLRRYWEGGRLLGWNGTIP